MWRLLLSWRYCDTDNDDGSERILSARNKFMANATYRPNDRTSCNLTARTTSGYSTSQASTVWVPVDGHTIFDMAIRVRTGSTRDDSVFLRIDNLTDRRITEVYPSTSTIPPTPGWPNHRQAVIGYTLRF